jgi:hypothetical protein
MTQMFWLYCSSNQITDSHVYAITVHFYYNLQPW